MKLLYDRKEEQTFTKPWGKFMKRFLLTHFLAGSANNKTKKPSLLKRLIFARIIKRSLEKSAMKKAHKKALKRSQRR